MNKKEARAYFNYLMGLCLRNEEAFGPLALTLMNEQDLDELGLMPEEQFNLIMSTLKVMVNEPKRHGMKIEWMRKARGLLDKTVYNDPQLAQNLDYEIKKTEAELDIYKKAMHPPPRYDFQDKQSLIVQCDAPEYFLDIAPKRASTYYQNKFVVSNTARTAQHFGGGPRKFDPDNIAIQREFSGSCPPFMNSRINGFHLMLPFDLKITRKFDEPLEGGLRIYYSKMGYSFPLSYEVDKLVSYYDGEVLDISMDDPNLLFVSVSMVKEPEFKFDGTGPSPGAPPAQVYPLTVLDRLVAIGPFLQVVTNFKIWYDASVMSLLVEGAPDLNDYGLAGGRGMLIRTHAADKLPAYAETTKEAWMEGLSFNFVNIHLGLLPAHDAAFVPYNTPMFSIYPLVAQKHLTWTSIEGMRESSKQ